MTKKTKDPKRRQESPEVIKQKLEQLAKELDELSFPTSPIDLELASWVASAIHLYLDGNAKTLDTAFGLGKEDTYKAMDTRRRQAKIIRYLKRKGLSWPEIVDIYGTVWPVANDSKIDERRLQRIRNEFLDDELIERLEENDP